MKIQIRIEVSAVEADKREGNATPLELVFDERTLRHVDYHSFATPLIDMVNEALVKYRNNNKESK